MKQKIKYLFEYLFLAFAGAKLVVVSAYIQWTLIDFDRYGLGSYLLQDMQVWVWWLTVGFPFLLGILYLGAAVSGVLGNLMNRSALILCGGCFVLGCTLSIVSAEGYFAGVVSGLCFASVVYRHKHSAE